MYVAHLWLIVTCINANILLHTRNPSVDLNRRPSAPRNVVFDVMDQNRDSLFIGAQWEMFVCESNFSCVELLGYVITCRAEISMEEVTNTVWLSDFQNEIEVFQNARVQVKYFTRYDCTMASLNTYGVGQPGSKVSLRTPETSAAFICRIIISMCNENHYMYKVLVIFIHDRVL